jgi:uncharacterized membrane protein
MADNLKATKNNALNENVDESNGTQIDYNEQDAILMEENAELKERIVELKKEEVIFYFLFNYFIF